MNHMTRKVKVSRRLHSRSETPNIRKVVAVAALGFALGACSKPGPPVSVLGIHPGMDCETFAEIVFPLHQNYKKLVKVPEFQSLQFGDLYLTKAALRDACAQRYKKKGLDRMIHVATDSGTPVQVDLTGGLPFDGFEMTIQSWTSGNLFSAARIDVLIADGKLCSSKKGDNTNDLRRKAEEKIIGQVVASLGDPVVEAKPNGYTSRNAQFWRRGDYLICRGCGGFIRVRNARDFIEADLKDSPDVERVADALRKDGLKSL